VLRQKKQDEIQGFFTSFRMTTSSCRRKKMQLQKKEDEWLETARTGYIYPGFALKKQSNGDRIFLNFLLTKGLVGESE
jgi:hypothetical protein